MLVYGRCTQKFILCDGAIKFYLSHGGAFPASYAARMDHVYGARIDGRQKIYKKPSTYLEKFYFDTLVFSVDQLEFLIKKYGADHVAIGTDYPADMAEHDQSNMYTKLKV